MQLGLQSIIARNAGCSVSHLNNILYRRAVASPTLAIALERVTGIDRRAWVWPDEFKNPMIEGLSKKKNAECGESITS